MAISDGQTHGHISFCMNNKTWDGLRWRAQGIGRGTSSRRAYAGDMFVWSMGGAATHVRMSHWPRITVIHSKSHTVRARTMPSLCGTSVAIMCPTGPCHPHFDTGHARGDSGVTRQPTGDTEAVTVCALARWAPHTNAIIVGTTGHNWTHKLGHMK